MTYGFTTSPHLLEFEAPVALHRHPTQPKDNHHKDALHAELASHVEHIADKQSVLYAHDVHALLLVFQGMDASGKDGTIRKVLSGVNPAGCSVTSFKAPNSEEMDHDYLWRVSRFLPPRGTIGAFNRSHYEDVLAVRVHPELLGRQKLRSRKMLDDVWPHRYRAIRDWERHLADNGTVILKFFLHLSREEQRTRLLERIDDPQKRWKFDARDLTERALWADYQHAYEAALTETNRPWAPWYVIPADEKAYARAAVARIVRETLDRLDLSWPQPNEASTAALDVARKVLVSEKP